MRLTEGFASVLYPFVKHTFRVRKNVCYNMTMGFLCGFPMGAKVTADLYAEKLLTKREAEFLLCFCNNIGPVYFCGFVLPLLKRKLLLPYLAGMYAVPLLYGIVLRYTLYRDIPLHNEAPTELKKNKYRKENILEAADNAVNSSIQSILSLGGYMVLFNLLNLIPHICMGAPNVYLAPVLEITGGLSMLTHKAPLYSLLLLPFGGFSCIAQTYSCIHKTGLSILKYILHKLILTFVTMLYYALWYLLSTDTFLR